MMVIRLKRQDHVNDRQIISFLKKSRTENYYNT